MDEIDRLAPNEAAQWRAALASMRSGFLVAAGNDHDLAAGAGDPAASRPPLGQHERAAAGAHDRVGDLDRRQLGAAGVEVRDDLQYGWPLGATGALASRRARKAS